MTTTIINSPIGPLTLTERDGALVRLSFGAHGPCDPPTPLLRRATGQLNEYFAGTRQEFDVPLDPHGSSFQLSAWRGLTTIPFAETVSYGEQARRLGHDGKARAIGAANGSNPLPVIVPCHRVIGADGSLTGFGGGLETKAWLLHHERVVAGLELPL
jgi:methylated-DNA-[protein]-cysteine S-methyltransferase